MSYRLLLCHSSPQRCRVLAERYSHHASRLWANQWAGRATWSSQKTNPCHDALPLKHYGVKALPLGMLLILANVSLMTHTDAAAPKDIPNSPRPSSQGLEMEWDSFMADSMDPNETDESVEEQDNDSANYGDDENRLPEPDSFQDDTDELMKNLPQEDDETTCTICLLNRQGPCRPYWRKVEWCLKHQDKKEKRTDEDHKESSSPCDKYMIPWLHCVQEYRNTYTVLMNSLYQHDFIDPVEATVRDSDRVLFDKLEPEAFLNLDAWKQYLQHKNHTTLEVDSRETDKDVTLIEASAKIHLWDPATNRPLTIAYIRDQNDKVLGFDQFRKEKEQRKQDHGQLLDTDVAWVTFYIEPETIQSIQLFALYESENLENDDTGSAEETTTGQSTLYYSHRIDMDPQEKTKI